MDVCSMFVVQVCIEFKIPGLNGIGSLHASSSSSSG